MAAVKLEWALAHGRGGRPVHPLHWPIFVQGQPVRCSCRKGERCGKSTGKHSALPSGWQAAATTNEATIRAWWTQWPDANIGGVLGDGDGLFALDVDGPEGRAAMEALEAEHGPLPSTYVEASGRDDGGEHRLFHTSDPAMVPGNWDLVPHVNTRGKANDGGAGNLVLAGSLHYTGRQYVITNNVPVAEAPAWLLSLLQERRARPVVAPPTATGPLPELADAYTKMLGGAYRNLVARIRAGEPFAEPGARLPLMISFSGALSLACPGMSIEQHMTLLDGSLQAMNAQGVDEDAREVMRRLLEKSYATAPAYKAKVETFKPFAAPPPAGGSLPKRFYRTSEAGAAERFRDANAARLRHCPAWKCWLHGDGKVWAQDSGNAAAYAAFKSMMLAVLDEARACSGEEGLQKALTEHARKLQDKKTIDAVLSLAAREAGMQLDPAELDQHPDLLCCSNGVVDLRTGELRSHDPALLMSKMVEVNYDPAAMAPRWEQFLREVACGDTELVAYLQKVAGYLLCGDRSEQKFFLSLGAGANGKSVMSNLFQRLMGPYATTTCFDTFTRGRVDGGERNRPALASFQGRRLVVAGEASSGVHFDEALVKSITGNDTIEAAEKHKNPIRFRPVFALWLHANFPPSVTDAGHAWWRRVVIIPFAATFGASGMPADPQLERKLAAELPGILSWMVQGARRWYAEGLGSCRAIDAATAAYQRTSNPVSLFAEDVIESAGVDTFTATRDLFRAYTLWCSQTGRRPVRDQVMSERLAALGFARLPEGERVRGQRGFIGLRLRPGAVGVLGDVLALKVQS